MLIVFPISGPALFHADLEARAGSRPDEQVARASLLLLAALSDDVHVGNDAGDDNLDNAGQAAAAALSEPGLVPTVVSLLTSDVAKVAGRAASALRQLTNYLVYPQVRSSLTLMTARGAVVGTDLMT